MAGVGDQEVAVGSVPEEIGVAAWQQPGGCGGVGAGAEGRLIAAEDPRVAGVRTGVSEVPSASKAGAVDRGPIPAHRPKAPGVAGP